MMEKITDRIYYMQVKDEFDRPVLGVVIGDKYSLVIDAGNSPKHAIEFKQELDLMKVPPVKYLVITHYHWDHIFGLCEWNAASIANQLTINNMQKYRNIRFDNESLQLAKINGLFSDYEIKCIKSEIEDRNSFQVESIDISYSKHMKVYLGGITCEIRNIISPHTDDSTIVYIPEERTLFLGDSVYGYTKQGYNYFDKEKLFQSIDIIEQYQADYYVCGHETVCTRKEINAYWQQLRVSCEFANKCTNLHDAMKEYNNQFGIEPSEEILFYMKSFGLREV